LIEDIGVMKDDKDVYKMTKWLAQKWLVAGRHVNLSTVMIKHLQGLVYWVNGHTLCQQLITVADFTVKQMNSVMSDKIYWKECASGSDSSIKDLSKFNPNEFEIC
jgi:hypothetical protein